MENSIQIIVAKNGLGDYQTIKEAIEYATSFSGRDVVIHIANGIYKERLEIKKDNLMLIGESKENCIIEYNDYASFIMEDGEKRGTFRTPSVFIDCNNFTARNITFANTAGQGKEVGQALALYVDGDRMVFENCNIFGGQDTLFAGPLPEAAFVKNGFKGPKEFDKRVHGRHLYKRCYICGDVDFIFGSATCYFESCDIHSNDVGKDVNGYICAPSTTKGKEGMIFNRCRFISNCPKETVYFARPWRNDARMIVMNSYIGSHIKREGFHDWNKEEARETVFFAEYNNAGPGAKLEGRAPWAKVLTDSEAVSYTRENVLGF